ncbi:MAG: cytochrome b/b6 domain-containing protein [Dehalococcoidia bacterium]|nr:cytochrome b/b6 domain-containing protein [Dehalococcoidia bacterium]
MTAARQVERFRMRTIYFHWIHTAAFVALLITGAILFFPPFGIAAAGGVTRLVHRVSAVIFIVGPIAYFPFNPKMMLEFLKDTFTWGMDDIKWLKAAPDYYFGGPEERMPPQPHVNPGQKMWQLVILGTGLLFLVTGIMMWFFKDILAPGFFEWCVIIHDVAFVLALLMLLVHIYLGVIHPRMAESFRSMIDGKISVTYAKHHYGKWYAGMSGKK